MYCASNCHVVALCAGFVILLRLEKQEKLGVELGKRGGVEMEIDDAAIIKRAKQDESGMPEGERMLTKEDQQEGATTNTSAGLSEQPRRAQ